jgi:hypothetical protein
MSDRASDAELKCTRRLFLQHSAVAAATSATLVGIAMKTDALARPPVMVVAALLGGNGDDGMPYPYSNP